MTLQFSDGAAVPSSVSVSALFPVSSGARTSASAACTRWWGITSAGPAQGAGGNFDYSTAVLLGSISAFHFCCHMSSELMLKLT